MSIHQKIRIIQRAEGIVTELQASYSSHSAASEDLNKLSVALKQLLVCLDNLDNLQPHHTTSEIEKLMRAVDLDNTILKGELKVEEYLTLNKAIRAVKVAAKYHPTKYSTLEFVVLWFYELIYFV